MELAILIGNLMLRFGPTLAKEFQLLFAKGDDIKQEDWDKVFALAAEPWKDMNASEEPKAAVQG